MSANDYIRIEYPSAGATYSRREFGVYRYGVHPRSSVLAGQESRTFLGSYATEAEARAAHPEAEAGVAGCGYRPPYLGHLPDEDGPDPLGDNEAEHNDMLADYRWNPWSAG